MPALPSRPSTTIARRCAASCTDRTLHRFCQAFTPSASANRGQSLRTPTALQRSLFAVVTRGCLVCYRRVSLLAARSRDGLLSELTAGARHLCDGASDFGPLYRSSDPSRGGGIGPSRRPALASSVSSYQRVLR